MYLGISLSTLYHAISDPHKSPAGYSNYFSLSFTEEERNWSPQRSHSRYKSGIRSPVCSDSKVCDLSSYHGLIKKGHFATQKEAELES